MATGTIAVSVEATPKKAFATAVDWPGWSRSGKTEELALAALADYAPRYAVVAAGGRRAVRAGRLRGRRADRGRGRHRLRRPVLDHGPRPPARGRRGGRAPGAPRRGGLDRLRPRRRGCARRAAQGPARRRPGPRQDGRPRRRVRRRTTPARSGSRASGRTRRTARRSRPCAPRCSSILRRPSDGSALAGRTGPPATRRAGSPGTPSTTPGRWRTGPSPPEARAPGPRSGPIGRTARTSAAAIGRGPSINPTAAAASPMSSAAVRPAARRSRTDVSPSAFDSFRPSGRRISGWCAKAAGVSRPSRAPRRICAGRLAQQVPAADDEVHALAQVVDDDSEPVGPVPVAVGERRVAVVRDLVRAWADESIHPALRAAAERDAQDRPVESALATAAGAARSVPPTPVVVRPRPRTSCASSRSRRRALHREGEPARPRTGRRRRTAGSGRRRRGSRATRGPRAGRPRTPDGSAPGRGPRCAAGRRPRPRPPCPTRRWRSPRDRDGGIRSAPGRTRPRPASTRCRRSPSVGAVPVARLERARGGEQPAVERQQVRLGERALVRHRHAQEDLALALGVADRSTARRALGPAGLARQFGALVEHRDEPAVEGVDPLAQAAQLGRLEVRGAVERSGTRATEPAGDRFEGQVIAARPLADDRLERDVVQVVDLAERLAPWRGPTGGPR